MRWAKALREFRLAGVIRASYTDTFHALGCASVAQWQSTGFVNLRLWVRLPPLASQARKPSIRSRPTGQASSEVRVQKPEVRRGSLISDLCFLISDSRIGHCPGACRHG